MSIKSPQQMKSVGSELRLLAEGFVAPELSKSKKNLKVGLK